LPDIEDRYAAGIHDSSTKKWEKRNRSTFAHQIGGPNLSLRVMFSNFSKACIARRRLPDGWHTCIPEWMESIMETNGYPVVNSEKTIFMKREGTYFIMHGLFVDDMMEIPTCDRLHGEFLKLHKKDFKITG
jgi:hypothetical protein